MMRKREHQKKQKEKSRRARIRLEKLKAMKEKLKQMGLDSKTNISDNVTDENLSYEDDSEERSSVCNVEDRPAEGLETSNVNKDSRTGSTDCK